MDHHLGGLIHGIKLVRSAPLITHLMFVNDIVVFLQANQVEADNLKSCIQNYQDWLG